MVKISNCLPNPLRSVSLTLDVSHPGSSSKEMYVQGQPGSSSLSPEWFILIATVDQSPPKTKSFGGEPVTNFTIHQRLKQGLERPCITQRKHMLLVHPSPTHSDPSLRSPQIHPHHPSSFIIPYKGPMTMFDNTEGKETPNFGSAKDYE